MCSEINGFYEYLRTIENGSTHYISHYSHYISHYRSSLLRCYPKRLGGGGSSAHRSQSSGPAFLIFPTLGSTFQASSPTREGLGRSVGGLAGSTGANHLA